jgi:hypothetical protein
MPTKTNTAQNGIWGGQQVRLTVTDEGANLDFDCANGVIEGPLLLDSAGRFDVPGVYVQEHGGPVRQNEDNRQAARYTGTVDGETLTLTIKMTKSDHAIGPLTFKLGKRVRIFKCM